MAIQLARANSDGRWNERYSNTNLSQFDEKAQIHATYGWTRPRADRNTLTDAYLDYTHTVILVTDGEVVRGR